jgi:hypothetical protein
MIFHFAVDYKLSPFQLVPCSPTNNYCFQIEFDPFL